MLVGENIVTAVEGVPLNSTLTAPVKPVPAIVTNGPTGPLAGVKEVMVGAGGAVAVPVTTTVAVRAPSVLLTVVVAVPAVVGAVNCTVTVWVSAPVALVVAVAVAAKGAPPVSDTSTAGSELLMVMEAFAAKLAASNT
jgi:hypothetical protein